MPALQEAVTFDVQAAKAALNLGSFSENKPGQMAFAKFDIPNQLFGTRTILMVNHHGGEIHVRVKVVPFSYVETGDVADLDCVISDGDFHAIESVEYDELFGTVTFNFPNTPQMAGLYARVSRNGQCNFRTA